jgi:hypothetical protein
VERATLLPRIYHFDPRLAARSAAYVVPLVMRSLSCRVGAMRAESTAQCASQETGTLHPHLLDRPGI